MSNTTMSNIGTILESLIHEQTGKEITCVYCREKIEYLNTLTSTEILDDLPAIAERIVNHAANTVQDWYTHMNANMPKAQVVTTIMNRIAEACDRDNKTTV